MNMLKKILLAEDDANFGPVLKSYLEMHNYTVTLCTDGNQAYSMFKANAYDICILDVMMPHRDGFTLAQDIRKANQHTPFVFLTARNQKQDIIKGFKTGADDYINKPFDSELLLLKLDAILKRGKTETKKEYELGNVLFNPHTRLLLVGKTEKRLSPKENALLKMLCEHKNEVLTRKDALEQIWGEDNYFTMRSMDVYITKLRKYLKPEKNISIENIHSNGYLLKIS